MAASNVNRVVLTGNLTRDPRAAQHAERHLGMQPAGRVQQPPQGPHVRRVGGQPNYLDVTVWGAQAENCATYLEKGRPAAIDGGLEWREWECPGRLGQAPSDVDRRRARAVPRHQGGRRGRRPRRRRATSPTTPPTLRRRWPAAVSGATTTCRSDQLR